MFIKKEQFRLCLAFFTALASLLLLPIYLPWAKLTFFAPFLVIAYYKTNFPKSFLLAFGCGTFLDFISNNQHFGIYALNYCLTTVLLYSQKRHFFRDKPLTIPIMTLIFAFLSTCIQIPLLYSFEKGFLLSWQWVGTDLLLMPVCDALYAYLLFTLPNIYLPLAKKREYFLKK